MKNKSRILLWAGIILTFVYIVGAVSAFIVIPEKLYYFWGFISACRLPPVWCVLSVAAFLIQTLLVTILLIIDAKNKSDVKKDALITTIGGLLCLVLCFVPASVGVFSVFVDYVLSEPKCYEFNNDKNKIIIKESTSSTNGTREVYYFNTDGTVDLIGSFSVYDGYRSEGKYDLTWENDSVIVGYDTGRGSIEQVVCIWAKAPE